jgi:hypothetical protein
LDGNPDAIIGSPMSVLDTMHTNDVKDGNHYFDVGEDDCNYVSEQEEPLTWSLDEPGNLSDWIVEVMCIHSLPSLGGPVGPLPPIFFLSENNSSPGTFKNSGGVMVSRHFPNLASLIFDFPPPQRHRNSSPIRRSLREDIRLLT